MLLYFDASFICSLGNWSLLITFRSNCCFLFSYNQLLICWRGTGAYKKMIKITVKLIFSFFCKTTLGVTFVITSCWLSIGFILAPHTIHLSPFSFLPSWGKTKPVNHRYFLFLISYQYCLIPFHPNQYGTNTFLSIHLKESKSCHRRQIKASAQKKQSTASIFNRSCYSLRRNCRQPSREVPLIHLSSSRIFPPTVWVLFSKSHASPCH